MTSRCDHVDGLTGTRCIAAAVGTLLAPELGYCRVHYPRALRLAVLQAVHEVEDRIPGTRRSVAVVSCPPNPHHAGTVSWAYAGNGNACPTCGRFA